MAVGKAIAARCFSSPCPSYAFKVTHTQTPIYTRTRAMYVRGITGRKKGPRLLIGCEQTAILEPAVFVTSVSSRRLLCTCHGIWSNHASPLPLPLLSLLFSFSFFLFLCSRFFYLSSLVLCPVITGILSAIRNSYTLANAATHPLARSPIFLSPRFATCLSPIPWFSFLLSNLSFPIALSLLFLVSCALARFRLRLRSLLPPLPARRSVPSRSPLHNFFFPSHILTSLVASSAAPPFSRSPPFYFYLSFASFRILRIRFSVRALFHASFPPSSVSSCAFYPRFLPPATISSNFFRCFAVLDLLWSLIKKNNRKDVIGAASEAEH